MNSTQIFAERAQLIAESRLVSERGSKETPQRPMNAEERSQVDAMFVRIDELEADAKRAQTQERLDASLKTSQGRITQPAATGETPEAIAKRAASERRAFNAYLTGNRNSLAAEDRNAYFDLENRALSSGSGTQAGSLVAPIEWVNELILFVKNLVVVRQLAGQVFSVPNAQSLGMPSLDADPADADWTTELLTGSTDSTMAVGKREFIPRPMAKRLLVSKKLARQVPSIDALVRDRIGYKVAVTEEKAFMTGDGVNKPLGLFTASANGIPTTQDTDSATGTPTATDIITTKYSLKQQYMQSKSLRCVLNRPKMAIVRNFKDENNQFLWNPSGFGTNLLKDGIDTILEVPVVMSEYAPAGTSAGDYFLGFFDLNYYWIADALDTVIEAYMELYSETNQNLYIARKETDGMPVLAEAFVRLTY